MSFVIVLDNVDHHEAELQERVFVVGQSLADTWPAAVFISLRPDTFFRSRKAGSVAAYQPRVFTVSPPRAELVISKRLVFARDQLLEKGRLESMPENLTIDSDKLLAYLDVLIEAFNSNEQLKEFVENLSSGSIRRALDFVTTFVGSGYVATSRILEAYERGDLYTVPMHEFIRSVMYGDYSYYDPQASEVSNVYDIFSVDGREHFLTPILLAACQAQAASISDGFIDEGAMYQHLQALGYSAEQIESHIDRSIDRKLLQSGREGGPRKLRVTSAGAYMYKRMMAYFTYLDAMVVDTPITDPVVRAKIRDIYTIKDRTERARQFCDYLDSCWDFEGQETSFSWPIVSAALRDDIASVDLRAERTRLRRELNR
ncbi:hypothetical protein [Pseudofrankia sp. BMG5.37]|uniref:hypothetical protein n=1 Tax=Pseudofrankia sp. BMG5.37 TaxID=3050035 RepID=UPI002894C32B|nr:hypothetical protein [Pseudofrankia sp. BMG5.37]MDT3445989.1 hypothetical protein [Pseudofrankia sp. BMG5.37]